MDRQAAIDDLLELLAEWLVDDYLAQPNVTKPGEAAEQVVSGTEA